MSNEPTREALAAYAHEAWSGWMKYMFGKGYYKVMELDGSIQTVFVVPNSLLARWERQARTSYQKLPESEKASDREEADKMLAIVSGKCFCDCDPCKYCDQLLEMVQP